ncbi:MAG: hypothetical protein AAGG38_02015 [Planctomycetota bacterium]
MKSKHIIYVTALALLASVIAACSGLDFGDVISVKTPQDVVETTGLPTKLSLNEAETEYQNYVEDFQRGAAQWKGNIEKQNQVRGVVNQFTLGVLDSVGPAIAGVPVLAPFVPLLTGLGGLVLKRPGDVSKDDLRKQKEDSYNAGLEVGKQLAASPS